MDTLTITLSREQSFILLKLVKPNDRFIQRFADCPGDAVERMDLI
jgi:hypothetical protein